MNLLLDLFLSFAKVGLFTFGGGYAMIALIESTCVEKKKWNDPPLLLHHLCDIEVSGSFP